jgi:hypothetical protein
MFHRATKRGSKLRCAIYGPAGSGKTFTALRMATGIGGRIALIDTERGTASKYADRFAFDVCNLEDRSIEGYEKAIIAAAPCGVLVIDSLSHGWGELLQEIDKLAATRFRGNKWAAWSEGTPKQKRLIEAILGFPGHVIATMRSTTEWQTVNDGGRARPQRVGLKPEQRAGIEFEFDLVIELSTNHIGEVTKDRSGKWQDAIVEKPGEEFGRELAAWLATEAPLPPSSTSNRGGAITPGLPQRPSPAVDNKPPAPRPASKY